MADEIVIEAYEKTDREECIRLLADTFPGTSDEATFKWRFESGGRLNPVIICAKHQGKIVSFNSWLPWVFTYGKERYLGYQSGESATHTAYRGKGIFKNVVRNADQIALQKGIDFFFGFPNPVSYSSFIKSGYCPVETYRYALRLLHPFGKRKTSGIGRAARYFEETMLIQDDRITPTVNRAYGKWRYDDNPKDYEVHTYKEDGSHAVFVLQRNIRKGIPEALLLDFQLTNYNDIFVEHALRYIDTAFSRRACYIRTFFSENTDRGRTLRKYFPIQVKSKYQVLIVKSISDSLDMNILLNANNWDLMPHCVDWL